MDTIVPDVGNTPLGTPSPEGEAKTDPAAGTPDEPFFRTYKTKEDADKGFSELTAAKTRAEQKAAELEKQLQAARDEKLDNVASLAQQLAQQGQTSQVRQTEEELRALAEKYGMEPEALDYLGNTIVQSEDRLRSEYEKALAQKMEEQENRYKELLGNIEGLKLQTNPVYQQNKEQIDAFVHKFDVPVDKAIQIMQEIAVPTVSEPGSSFVGLTASNRATVDQTARLSKQDHELIRSMMPDVTDEELRGLEERMKA